MPMTAPELAALDAWLAGTDEGKRFDLLTITTRTGIVLRWTNADTPLTTADGRTFVPAAYERDRLKTNASLQIDDVQLTLYVDTVDAVAGVPMLAFAARGGLDGAQVLLEWLFMDVSDVQQGYVTRFEGRTGPAETGLGTVDISIRSLLAQLNDEQTRLLKKQVVNFASLVAGSAGGFLGVGKVSGSEQKALARIEAAFAK